MNATAAVYPNRPAPGIPKVWRAAALLADVLVGIQTATQVAANTFRYHATLGPNFHGLYPIWDFFLWQSKWGHVYPAVFNQAQSAGLMAGAGAIIVTALAINARGRQSKGNPTLHGSARWANWRDVKQSGLLRDAGVYVGGWEKDGMIQHLRHGGSEHVLVIAPPRSGKGVSVIVPTLLSWNQSALITDPKGELWALTSGWRQSAGHKTLKFEPASEDSCAFNPLAEVRVGTSYEVADVQNVATLLMDPNGEGLDSGGDRAIWKINAHSLLTGCILQLIADCASRNETATLPELARMLGNPREPVPQVLVRMIESERFGTATSAIAASIAEEQRSRPEREGGSVLSFARSALTLYRDPVVARNVSRSDFRVADLMHAKSPLSLYVVTQPVDQSRLRPLVRLLLSTAVRVLASKLEFEDGEPVLTYQHRLLLLLDEFISLGKMAVIQDSLAFLPGYGIKAMIIIQDRAQLLGTYGKDETITACCGCQVAFAPNLVETAEYLSKLCGDATVIKEQVTRSGQGFSAQTSRTVNEIQRRLLTPDEVMRLPGPQKDARDRITKPGEMLIAMAGRPVIRAVQPLYFFDPIFKERASMGAAIPATNHATL